jgi:hypothetical protein
MVKSVIVRGNIPSKPYVLETKSLHTFLIDIFLGGLGCPQAGQ